ncbi:Chromate resistance protein ChrB [Paenibacillus piri]|uniref:CRISPR-associated endoribonuclease Cas2 n=1 Tax=Paenibacillus piri TaxID=2547395 RepID=A0A4R5KI42_9BACL|nr:Chromate resistance protein ChrB [Paenibacillus piri]TDF95113.1 hypothetical protein E1757_21500 [Paenibacillus piri]
MRIDQGWFIFSYKVPSEPSTLRVRAWRTLKSLGAMYIQQSVCVAPDTAEVRKKMMAMKKLIEANEGEALLLEVSQLAGYSEEHLCGLFNQQRMTEYEEFLGGCKSFLQELELETGKGNFSFHEVEENEAELAKLERWVRKIAKRDFFNCSRLYAAMKKLEQCEHAFSEFTSMVYRTEGRTEGDISAD